MSKNTMVVEVWKVKRCSSSCWGVEKLIKASKIAKHGLFRTSLPFMRVIQPGNNDGRRQLWQYCDWASTLVIRGVTGEALCEDGDNNWPSDIEADFLGVIKMLTVQ